MDTSGHRSNMLTYQVPRKTTSDQSSIVAIGSVVQPLSSYKLLADNNQKEEAGQHYGVTCAICGLTKNSISRISSCDSRLLSICNLHM